MEGVEGGDVSTVWTRNETGRHTAFDAARFGEPDLAIAVLGEAVPVSERESYEFLSDVTAIRLEAAQYEEAEALARRIIERAPYRFGEMRSLGEDEKVGGHTFLIISLLKQDKEIGDLVDRLFTHVKALPTSLSGHADNFLIIAGELAGASPEIARRFLKAGQKIYRVDDGTADFFSRYREVDACKALHDDACLLRIAQESETDLNRDSWYFSQIAALPYAVAGDFDSVRRLMPSVANEHCYRFIYFAIAERLAQDNHLSAIPGWLRAWVKCQMNREPNDLHWSGLATNRWSKIAHTYARLSHWQSDAGRHRAALNSARMALLLAMETEKTWTLNRNFYRVRSLARAYGSALGALVRAEAAISARR